MRANLFNTAPVYIIVAALLTGFGFTPFRLYVFGFIPFIVIFTALQKFRPSTKQTIWLALLYALVVNIIGYHWLIHTIQVYGMMPAFVAFPIFALYVAGTSTRLVLFFLGTRYLFLNAHRFRRSEIIALLAALWGLSELIGWQLLPYFGANLVSADLPFMQIADTIGIRGLSVVWIALQIMAFFSIHDLARHFHWKFFTSLHPLNLKNAPVVRYSLLSKIAPHYRLASVYLVLITLIHTYGFARIGQFEALEKNAPKALVGVPQGNVPLITAQHERPYIIARMVAQSRLLAQHSKRPDLIVWPESSIPAMEFERTVWLKDAIVQFQRESKIPLVINDIYHDSQTNKDYSNMSILDADGKVQNSYQKNFLFPFGEFMPFGDTFPALKNLFPAVSDFSHGEKFALFDVPLNQNTSKIRLMPLICYEIILPDYALKADRETGHGAQAIINITNDAWFGHSIESLQHMELGIMRAIELRLPIVRSTNAGVSAYIASWGDVSGKTALFERANILYELPAMPRTITLFSILGNIPLYLFIAALGLYFLVRQQKGRETL